MDILSIIKDIEREGTSQKRTMTAAQRQSLKHTDIDPFGLSSPGSIARNPILPSLTQPRQLVAQIYRIPVLGYLLNLLAYGLRLPTQIRKLQQELHQLRCAIAALESRLAQKDSGDEELEAKIHSFKLKLNNLTCEKS